MKQIYISTVCTHRYADCLLRNTSTDHKQYVVNQKLDVLMISVTENFLVESEWFFFGLVLQNERLQFLL